MNFSTILKGAAVAASFALVVSEASAQLPVRTQQLRLLAPDGSGHIAHQAPNTTTTHTLTWPAALPTGTDNGVLRTTSAGILSWQTIPAGDDIITGQGSNGQVAYFDGTNTITSSPTMTFDGTGGLDLGGTGAGTLTLGSSGTGNPNVVIGSNSTNGATFNLPSYGTSSGPFNVVATTNSGTTNQIPVVQSDGTVQWVDNPVTGMQRGTVNGTVNAYSQVITVVGTPDLTNDVIIVSTSNSAGTGNILQVTAVAANSITVSSTAPFDANDRISWIWIAIP